MNYLLHLIVITIVFSGCSFQSPPNQSQFKATTAFTSYSNNFLSNNDALANNDLTRAIEHTKQSADFEALSKMYLGECALNLSVGLNSGCQNYLDIQNIHDNLSNQAYYHLITKSISTTEIQMLPSTYQDFASHLVEKNFHETYKEILDMQSITSQLISASLVKESLDTTQINKIVELASFYGYKKSILFWLNELRNRTTNESEKKIISGLMICIPG